MVSDCSHAHALLGLVVYAPRSLHWLDASTQENFQSSVRRRGLHGSIYILASLPLPSRITSVSMHLRTSPLSSASGSNNPIDESCLHHPELDQVRSRFTLVSSIEMAYFGVFVCSHHNEGVHL
jgi:hypothetical protein